jgi:hypothetical protein
MKDDPSVGCGYGVTFRGWAAKACGIHDEAYLKGSDAQKWLSRKEVDDAFLRDLKKRAHKTKFPVAALAAAQVMYGVVRLFGGVFWEGKR